MPGFARLEIRLDDEITQPVCQQGQLSGIIGHPGGVLNEKGNALALYWKQFLVLDQGGKETRHRRFALLSAIDIVLKVCQHLEVLAQFRVKCR